MTGCYPEYGKLSIKNKVVDVPVVFRMSGGLADGGWLVTEYGSSWGTCNLPKEYVLKDSLALSVSGYFVTSEILERINIGILPFVVTSAKLR